MKKIILTVAAVFALSFANAQDKKESSVGFAKGDVYLTGAFSFSNDKDAAGVKTDGLTVAPGIGYFLTDKVALVGNLEYMSSKDASGAKTTGFGLHAGVKYFWTPASQFSLSIGGELGYDTEKNDVTNVKINTIGLNVPVGLNYFVSNSFALTSTWGGLNYSSAKADGGEAATKLGLNLDMSSIKFGLLYKL
ncbi:porin family protein [Flavobacterium sp. N1994]|uniref:porin family protein n=1 Tax=Flavobacterium sp. N1994 TaxID=2986827 RepID=UPI002223D47F|nr:porin family protein [Flavobacterium sp. N1994]